MDTAEIREYAKLLRELDLTALEIRADGTIRLERSARTDSPAAGRTALSFDDSGSKQAAKPESADGSLITAPMIGMFYIAPEENADPFVQPGSTVHKGDVLCIIESMKLMNEITAESDGVVLDILAVNGAIVEFGQPLFRMKGDVS